MMWDHSSLHEGDADRWDTLDHHAPSTWSDARRWYTLNYSLLPGSDAYSRNIWMSLSSTFYTLQMEHLDITPFYLLPSITSFYLTVMLTARALWITPFCLAVILNAWNTLDYFLLPGSDACCLEHSGSLPSTWQWCWMLGTLWITPFYPKL